MSLSAMHTLVVGYDFKETNNNILADGTSIFQAYADINQFMLGYEYGFRSSEMRVALVIEAYGNPGGITHGNHNRFYEPLRPHAKAEYGYLKLAQSWAGKFRWGWLSYDLTGQAATGPLLPSEQMTMTGYGAVRGFEERILNLDNAAILNLSAETPHISPAKYFGFCKAWDELYCLAFVDLGLGSSNHPPVDQDRFCHLASIGPGIRYQFDRYFTARLDYGFQIDHSGFHNPSHSRYNFGMILSY
jgi:hemolysin activation/secretion protein